MYDFFPPYKHAHKKEGKWIVIQKVYHKLYSKVIVCFCIRTHFPLLVWVFFYKKKKKKKVIVPYYLRECYIYIYIYTYTHIHLPLQLFNTYPITDWVILFSSTTTTTTTTKKWLSYIIEIFYLKKKKLVDIKESAYFLSVIFFFNI